MTNQPAQILCIPAFQDNYLWLIHQGKDAAVVDPGDPTPILRALEELQLKLVAILNTHHHPDHVGGNQTLIDHCGPLAVFGPAAEPIPGLNHPVQGGDRCALKLGDFEVLSVPGHTRAHLAYRLGHALFCGDTLFALGCGRLFEGSPEEMFASLARIAALPGDTLVYCAHEYTLSNLAFALEVDAQNPALQERSIKETTKRNNYLPTVPSLLSEEKKTNPFLRCEDAAVRASAERWAGHALDTPLAVFTALRAWKNNFTPTLKPLA